MTHPASRRRSGTRRAALRRFMLVSVVSTLLVLASGCDVFTPRSPEPPTLQGGTFLQPDEPETVVDNIVAAVAELNPENYARSLSDDLTFVPAAPAVTAYSWETWGKQDEVSYFRALAGVPQPGATHSLVLTEQSLEFGADRTTVRATYDLIVHHRRISEVADTLRGQLSWVIERREDGLWALQHWTDYPDPEESGSPTWSTIKAVFAQ